MSKAQELLDTVTKAVRCLQKLQPQLEKDPDNLVFRYEFKMYLDGAFDSMHAYYKEAYIPPTKEVGN